MYLTQAEADAKGLPSVQEQIDRHNAALRIVSLTAGQVERVGYVQPANTELRKVWGNGVYHYELRPAGYRTQYEREIEAEALASDAGQCFNCGLDHVLFFGASKCPRCGEGR